MKAIVGLLLSLAALTSAQAAAVTMEFTASGFQNGGVQYPGFAGPIQGRISWTASQPGGAVEALTDIELTIAEHTYSLAEVGIANQGTSSVAIGAAGNGFNGVVGSGEFHDFLLIFNRLQPAIENFAYSIQGKPGAIWWFPTETSARFVTQQVPEPATALLVLAALGVGAVRTRRR